MKKIVMLCTECESSAIVYNCLCKEFTIEKVIVEKSVPLKIFLKRRFEKLGFFKVIGQILFSILIVPLLEKEAFGRRKEILNLYGLSTNIDPLMESEPTFVDSVNSDECIETLKRINPDIVVVNGTRIISEKVLESVNACFINMHAGITPKYRGCHGAYWALYNNDDVNAGVTVHLVDSGIDTGGVLYQSSIPITDKDNFTTYPLLQACVGVSDEVKAINDIINNNIIVKTNNLPSALYTHPTIFQYLWRRIRYNVK